MKILIELDTHKEKRNKMSKVILQGKTWNVKTAFVKKMYVGDLIEYMNDKSLTK